MKKQLTAAGLFITLFTFPFFAEEVDSQIELPDLTTVVSGDSGQTDYAPPPSFEDVLEMPYNSGSLVPLLPSISADQEPEAFSEDQSEQKDIYAEGRIGGGYPASFTGNFEISRLYGADPFKISFNHDSVAGFSGHLLSDGYKISNTAIGLQKDFIRKNIKWGLSGRYEDKSNGFQGKVDGISAYNQDSVGLGGNLLWSITDEVQFKFDAASEFYFRFAEITKNSDPAFFLPDWIRNTSRVTFDPSLSIGWTHKGFELSFDALYNLEAWSKASNRGECDLNFSWGNEKVKLYSAVGIVFGNTSGSNKVIVPFSLGLDCLLPVYFSDRKLNLSLCGGLESKRNSTAQLEGLYAFSGLQELSDETSNWFGRVNLLVPLKTSFTGNVSAGYARTACNNGLWQPDYSQASMNGGLYGFTQKDRNELYTDFSFTWKYKLFAVTGSYYANWLDIPVLQNRHTFVIGFALQSQKGLWGISLDTSYLMDAADNKPVIDLEAFVQATSSVRIALTVDDMLKLLGAEERLFAGQYSACSGKALLLVKFLF